MHFAWLKMSLLELIRSDLRGMYGEKRFALARALLNPSFHALILLRLAQTSTRRWFWLWRNALIAKHGIDVGIGFSVGESLKLPHPIGIVIGGGAKVGGNVTIYQGATLGAGRGGYPTIGDGVVIYPNSVLVGPILIGDGAVIGACSFVDTDVDAGRVHRRSASAS